MDIDMSALRALEREKEISFSLLVRGHRGGAAHRLPAHRRPPADRPRRARPQERTRHGVGRARPTTRAWSCASGTTRPTGFGRIAATTAKQVILQRLRDAEDEQTYGEFAGKEGDIVSGVIQQGKDPRNVFVDLGRIEAVLPPPEQVPGESYDHGSRLRCYVVQVRKGMRGPSITLSRTHPNLVRKLFALEVPEIADGTVEIKAVAREAGHRTKIAVTLPPVRREREGRLHRPDGRAGASGDGRAARREDRHRRLVRRPGRPSSPRRCSRPGSARSRSSTPTPAPRGSSSRTTSCRWRSGARGRTPGSRRG